MNNNDSLKSLLEPAQTRSIQDESTRLNKAKIHRRLLVYANRRGLALIITLFVCTLVVYPVISPLLRAIFIEGNMVVLTIGGGCLALVLSVFLTQQIDDD